MFCAFHILCRKWSDYAKATCTHTHTQRRRENKACTTDSDNKQTHKVIRTEWRIYHYFPVFRCYKTWRKAFGMPVLLAICTLHKHTATMQTVLNTVQFISPNDQYQFSNECWILLLLLLTHTHTHTNTHNLLKIRCSNRRLSIILKKIRHLK